MIKINKVKNAAMKQVNATKKQMSKKAEKIRSSRGFQLATGGVIAAAGYYVFDKGVNVASTAFAEIVADAFNK